MGRISLRPRQLEGKSVCITGGSRGIDAIAEIIRTIVEFVKKEGGSPFVLPAMGSHGGCTEQGQVDVLKGLGITESTVGAFITPCIESVLVGETNFGTPAFCNRLALEADYTIVVNKIKKHTDFSGEIESGLHKMVAIGLGGPEGATVAHTHAMIHGYEKVICGVGTVIMEKISVLCCVGIVENWKGKAAMIQCIEPCSIYEEEKRLLLKAKGMAIKLPFERLHVLVVGEIGKDIIGSGMDGRILGRRRLIHQNEPQSPAIDRIVVLSLTQGTHGNALGIGLADLTTKRVYEEMDIDVTSRNCIISMSPEHCAIPCVMQNDKEAIEAGIRTAGLGSDNELRLVYIQNTRDIETIAISDSLHEEAKRNEFLSILDDQPVEMQFDTKGAFQNFRYAIT